MPITVPALARRTLLARLGSAAGAGMVMSGFVQRLAFAQALEKVRFTLPWLVSGGSSFPIAGKELGYFKSRGYDIEVLRGFGSGPTAQAIARGEFDIGLVSAPLIILNAAKGLPLKAVGTAQYNSTMGVGVLADSPIKQPADLMGRKLGVVPTSGELPFFYDWAKAAGFDGQKVEIVNLDGRVLEQTLITRQIDAMIGFASSSAPIFMSQNVPIRFMLYSDLDITMYGNTIVTRPDVVEKRPQFVRDIVAGMAEAIKYYLLNPEETVEIFMKAVPETALTPTGKLFARIGLGINAYTFLTPESTDNALCWADPKRVDAMIDRIFTNQAQAGDTKPSAATLYTNDFVGQVKLTAAEWDRVKANTAAYAELYINTARKG